MVVFGKLNFEGENIILRPEIEALCSPFMDTPNWKVSCMGDKCFLSY